MPLLAASNRGRAKILVADSDTPVLLRIDVKTELATKILVWRGRMGFNPKATLAVNANNLAW
jgi:hypothetical protein